MLLLSIWSNQLLSSVLIATLFVSIAIVIGLYIAWINLKRRFLAEKKDLEILKTQYIALTSENERLKSLVKGLKKTNQVKTRLFSVISHDLRGPVNIFTGMFALVKRHLANGYNIKNDHELEELIQDTETSSRQIIKLLNDLLRWANKKEGEMPYEPEMLNVRTCLAENIRMLSLSAHAKKIAFSQSIPAKTKVWADKNGIMTILRNIIGNSIKFTPPNGTIAIHAMTHDNEVKITVADNGQGMTKHQIRKAFDLYNNKSATGTRQEGMGIGLVMVKELLEINQGRIEIKSKLGKGTVCSIFLPVRSSELVPGQMEKKAILAN